MQFQADILGVPVVRPAVTETTAMGAAHLAAMAVGFWGNDMGAVASGKGRRFEPRMPTAEARSLRERWSEAVARSKNWESGTRV
jgi:glycerol kinase